MPDRVRAVSASVVRATIRRGHRKPESKHRGAASDPRTKPHEREKRWLRGTLAVPGRRKDRAGSTIRRKRRYGRAIHADEAVVRWVMNQWRDCSGTLREAWCAMGHEVPGESDVVCEWIVRWHADDEGSLRSDWSRVMPRGATFNAGAGRLQ